MQKERITDKEAICVLITFMIGSSLIIGIGGDAKNDAWISGIVGIAMSFPILLIYSIILSDFPKKDIFDILNFALGKIWGRIVSLLYIWYAFHLGALVLRNFGEFINIVAMPETPMLVPMFCLGLLCIAAAKLGIEVIGRTTTYFLPILFFVLLVVLFLAVPQLKLDYLKPILGNGLTPILKGGFSSFSFPFAETVVFLGVFSSLQTRKSPFKAYFLGILIAGFIITVITIRNIGVLGNMLGSFYFPSYEAVSMISIGDFIERIEVSVAFVFLFGVFIKASICLLAASNGIAKVFNLKDYRSIVIQTGLLMTFFAYTVYDNSMEMEYWAFKVYPYYAFPFQVLLPIIILILEKVKLFNVKEAQKNRTQQ